MYFSNLCLSSKNYEDDNHENHRDEEDNVYGERDNTDGVEGFDYCITYVDNGKGAAGLLSSLMLLEHAEQSWK